MFEKPILCLTGGVERHIGRQIGRPSVDISADRRLSVVRVSDEYRSSVGRYTVDV